MDYLLGELGLPGYAAQRECSGFEMPRNEEISTLPTAPWGLRNIIRGSSWFRCSESFEMTFHSYCLLRPLWWLDVAFGPQYNIYFCCEKICPPPPPHKQNSGNILRGGKGVWFQLFEIIRNGSPFKLPQEAPFVVGQVLI